MALDLLRALRKADAAAALAHELAPAAAPTRRWTVWPLRCRLRVEAMATEGRGPSPGARRGAGRAGRAAGPAARPPKCSAPSAIPASAATGAMPLAPWR
jgi:hypothetical protein